MTIVLGSGHETHCDWSIQGSRKLMDEVERTREAITIAKKGRPVAKLVPPDAPAKDVFGCLRGVMEIVGDVESPAIPAKDWKISR